MRQLFGMLLAAVIGAGIACAAQPAPDRPLAPWAGLVDGHLGNGVRYLVLEHPSPGDRVSVWLEVDVGSLDEEDDQRGLAHFIEHMAFNGSERFAPGEVIRLFQSLGLEFGRHQNAFTSLERTGYRFDLGDATPESLERALSFLADVAGGLTFPPEQVERERRVLVEELRARSGMEWNLTEQWMRVVVPGSGLAQRLPGGTIEDLERYRREDLVSFYQRWYRPSRMTVIVVGDMSAATMLRLVTEAFAGLPARDGVQRPSRAYQAPRGQRGAVTSDPGLAGTDVALTSILPRPEPPRTLGAARRAFVESVAMRTLGQRLSVLIKRGELDVVEAKTREIDLWSGARVVELSAVLPDQDWARGLAMLAAELRRAHEHGLGEHEVEAAIGAELADLERWASSERSVPASGLVWRLASMAHRGEVPRSFAQRAALGRELAPEVSASEVTRALRRLFGLRDIVALVQLPGDGGVPGADGVLEVASGVLARPAEPRATGRALEMRFPEIEPGRIVEISRDAASGVWSAWLDNGARVHVRPMDDRPGRVELRVALAGGEIDEGGPTRGLTDAAMESWRDLASDRLNAADAQQYVAGLDAEFGVRVLPQAVELMAQTGTGELEHVLRLVHLQLTEPALGDTAMRRWRARAILELKAGASSVDRALRPAIERALFPEAGSPGRPLSVEQIERVSTPRARAWLAELAGTRPIVVSVAGDVDPEQAIRLAARYVGSAPARARVQGLPGLSRALGVPAGGAAIVSDERVGGGDVLPEKAAVAYGFIGADIGDLDDVRRLIVAARVIESRLLERARNQAGLVYSISTSVAPGDAFPGRGLFVTTALVDPERAPELSGLIADVYVEFAGSGPSDEELASAKAQAVRLYEDLTRSPRFWAARLALLEMQGRTPGDVAVGAERYAGYTREQIRETLARYHDQRPKVRVTVMPAGR